MPKPTRWSYSSLSTYKECPRKWKFNYVDGLEWPASAAMARGTRMHLMAEEFVTGAITSVPREIQKIGPMLLSMMGMGAKAEEVWALNKNWTPVLDPVNDSDQIWVKAIIDVHYVDGDVLHVKDYKSGQMYDSHREQLELYGLIGLRMYPTAKRVEMAAIYMDTGHEGMQGSLIRPMIEPIRDLWEVAAQAMMADEVYEERPGAACKWCPYAKSKGGPCRF